MNIDSVQIQFSENTQAILSIVLGFIMFGVALEMKLEDFKLVLKSPKAALIGLALQFIVFPAFTFLLIWGASFSPQTAFYPSIALGMLLLAACPGGNMSNFLTHLAKGNTALSVSMSAVSTVAALIMTPLNFSFWGSMLPETSAMLSDLQIDAVDMLSSIITLLGIPLALGMLIAYYLPNLTSKIVNPMKYFSIGFFMLLVIGALIANRDIFFTYIGTFAWVVFLQNSMALAIGFWGAWVAGLAHRECKTVSIEVGIQNSGLGLVLFFQYFEHLGGMGIIIAWWGLWHIISGLTLATYWSRTSLME